MEWFRFYHEAVDDPKVQRLAPALFKHWVNLLCLASRNAERGTLPTVADLAFGLRISETKVRAILFDLRDAGLLDRDGETFRMHGWANRQKRSDDVTARVNKHRFGNADETLQETGDETFHETLPHVRVTETEQSRAEKDPPPTPKGEPYSTEFSEFWDVYPKKKHKDDAWRAWKGRKDRPPIADLIASVREHIASTDWTKDSGQYIPNPATWIRAGGWKDVVTARPNGAAPVDWSDPVAIEAYRQRTEQAMLRQL